MFLGRVKIRSFEKGLLFKDREFKEVLEPDIHWLVDQTGKTRVDVVSRREPWLKHCDLDLIISSGLLGKDAEIIELSDTERALVWVDNCFAKILDPGKYVLWRGFKHIRVEVIDATLVRLSHKEIRSIIESESAATELSVHTVDEGNVGILFIDSKLEELLPAGRHIFWKKSGIVKVLHVDSRESTIDVAGQDIISQDKVSLRLNGLTTYRVTDPVKAVSEVENFEQTLYRETQLALRAVVGTRDIDSLLSDKDSLAVKVRDILSQRSSAYGVHIIGFGIRDIILPGDMKELLNKVVEAKKVAEANFISKREETAAMRSQANTAKILESNPTLMRLRELEILEKITASSNLNILCGEGALSSTITKLL